MTLKWKKLIILFFFFCQNLIFFVDTHNIMCRYAPLSYYILASCCTCFYFFNCKLLCRDCNTEFYSMTSNCCRGWQYVIIILKGFNILTYESKKSPLDCTIQNIRIFNCFSIGKKMLFLPLWCPFQSQKLSIFYETKKLLMFWIFFVT